mmetsp:Transcript_6362/g.14110  ORF Transcript_6362/g.14110 Transcript_6362/m.14110 type:complete len:264 (-) Transcript_6362:496-1287(-)
MMSTGRARTQSGWARPRWGSAIASCSCETSRGAASTCSRLGWGRELRSCGRQWRCSSRCRSRLSISPRPRRAGRATWASTSTCTATLRSTRSTCTSSTLTPLAPPLMPSATRTYRFKVRCRSYATSCPPPPSCPSPLSHLPPPSYLPPSSQPLGRVLSLMRVGWKLPPLTPRPPTERPPTRLQRRRRRRRRKAPPTVMLTTVTTTGQRSRKWLRRLRRWRLWLPPLTATTEQRGLPSSECEIATSPGDRDLVKRLRPRQEIAR